MSAVALFSTYAPSQGFGGPARIYHMRLALEARGIPVVHVVLTSTDARGDLRHGDLRRVLRRPHGAPIDHVYDDLALAERAAATEVRLDIVEHLRRHDVGAIVLEQPFLVEVAEVAANELGIPIVYSSQNVEFRLRKALERFDGRWDRPAHLNARVRDLERRATAIAETVTAICPGDQEVLRDEFGRDSVLVPNGSSIAGRPGGPAAEGSGFAFAGSAYWPNVHGLEQVATPSLAFLPPDVSIDVAGTVCAAIRRAPQFDRPGSVNVARLRLRGFLDGDALGDLLAMSRAVIVPIFVGEGSNLKSADALASGAPVVMSRRAVAGYEDVLAADPDGVVVVDTPIEFRTAMADVLDRPGRDARIGRRRQGLLRWSHRLRPLADVVGGLVGAGSG